MSARIVVIDNDHFMRKVFTVFLEDAGWDVFAYGYSHTDLWTSVKQLQPDLIILNFTKQNRGDDWQFLQMIKMEDTTAQIPILITTTGFPFTPDMRGYLLAHYIQIVYQPFVLDTFLQLIRQTLKLARETGVIFCTDRSLPILVVDDIQDMREGLETILMLEGYEVVTAGNGLIALGELYHRDHCLIFLDINMPIMDGFEFLHLYDQQRRPHRPVIILSAETGLAARVLPSFVVDVIAKPFEVSRVIALAEKYTQAV